jgi:hypothetical protein
MILNLEQCVIGGLEDEASCIAHDSSSSRIFAFVSPSAEGFLSSQRMGNVGPRRSEENLTREAAKGDFSHAEEGAWPN